MRFMLLMIPDVYSKPAANHVPTPEEIAPMMKFNERLAASGNLIALDGLAPPEAGARVKFGGTKPVVVDGPFTEAKELVGGYWIIRAKSRQEAIDWAVQCPAFAGDMIEVRQLFDAEDYGPGALPEMSDEMKKAGAKNT